MARIRTIKPEFFTSEDIVSMSPLARLLFIAVWCDADREGRLLWKPRTFKLRYFPADDCDINAMCDELVTSGLVRLYGEGLAFIPTFAKHQHINPRESPSSLPTPLGLLPTAPPGLTPTYDASARVSTRHCPASDAQVGREGKGKEGKGKEGESDASLDATSPTIVSIPLVDGSEFAVTEDAASEWVTAYPAVDVPQQLRAMRAWCRENSDNRKTRAGVGRFIVRWLAKAQDTAPRIGGRSGPPLVGAMSVHGLQTMTNAQAVEARLFGENNEHAA